MNSGSQLPNPPVLLLRPPTCCHARLQSRKVLSTYPDPPNNIRLRRAACGSDASGLEEVFQCVGDALQRAAIDAAGEIVIGALGLFEGHFVGNCDEGVQAGLFRVD